MRLVAGAVCLVLGSSSAAAAPCPPGARVTGERAVANEIEPILRERGVSLASDHEAPPGARCGYIVAEVWKGGHRILVWVTDADGRRVERSTEDPAAAATVIESWARRDVMSPLLAARASIPLTRAAARDERPASPARPPHPQLSLLLGADVGVSGDGAVWSAGRAQGCARVGRACIGGIIRYGIDLERTGDTAERRTHRRGLELTVTAGLPLQRGRFTFIPAAGIGQTAMTASRDEDPSDVDLTPESEQASALHGALSGSSAIRLAPSWSLRLDLAVAVAPFATRHLGDGGIDALPASARLQTWLGVGLAYGGL